MTAPVVATHRQLPIFRSLSAYDRRWLRGDLIAGLTVWAVLPTIAEAIASVGAVGAADASARELP